jgi:predicted metallopeptidase
MGRRRKEPLRIEWSRLPSAEALVEDLVPKYHQHLRSARIGCVARPKAGKRHGKTIYASIKRADDVLNVLRADDVGRFAYVIVVGHDAWEKLSADQRRIVIDHELCHAAGQDPLGRWTLTGHDVEEFSAIIRRYGTWTADLQLFAKEVAQLSIPLEGTGPAESPASAPSSPAAEHRPRTHARRRAAPRGRGKTKR